MGKIRDFILRDFNVIPPTASPLAAPGLAGAVLSCHLGLVTALAAPSTCRGRVFHGKTQSPPCPGAIARDGAPPSARGGPGDVLLFCDRQEEAEWGFGDKIFLCFNGGKNPWVLGSSRQISAIRSGSLGNVFYLALLCLLPTLVLDFKPLFTWPSLKRRVSKLLELKQPTSSPACARVQQVKPLDNRDGISQMNWITSRYSALAHQGAGTGAGGPPPSHPPAHPGPGSVITVPGADRDWGIWGCPSSRKQNYSVNSL